MASPHPSNRGMKRQAAFQHDHRNRKRDYRKKDITFYKLRLIIKLPGDKTEYEQRQNGRKTKFPRQPLRKNAEQNDGAEKDEPDLHGRQVNQKIRDDCPSVPSKDNGNVKDRRKLHGTIAVISHLLLRRKFFETTGSVRRINPVRF